MTLKEFTLKEFKCLLDKHFNDDDKIYFTSLMNLDDRRSKMKFSINKRKSWFWHWFAMTAWNNPEFAYCAMNFRYDNPFTPVERPCAQYSNRWEAAMFYKNRALKNRHCKVYQH